MLSILITHYNRPKALMKCIRALRQFDFGIRYELVVSDDGSSLEVLNQIRNFDLDVLIESKTNKGLANNINKGLYACKGNYILYVQEDFLIDNGLTHILKDAIALIDDNILDLVRFRSNFTFPKLYYCTDNIKRIPKFSFKNFMYNTFQYSDHPFITTKNFYETYGYYLENTSVGYGETEYAIRIMKSKARLGITNINYFHNIPSPSTLGYDTTPKKTKAYRKIKRIARALRQHVEFIFYIPEKRGLLTYKNKRLKNSSAQKNL